MQNPFKLLNFNVFNKIFKFTLKISIIISFSLFSSCTSNESKYATMSNKLLGNGNGIGQIVFVVNDLKSTRNYYADSLGFSLPKSDKFKKGIYKGLITTNSRFPDMTSLQFLSIEDSVKNKNIPSYITNFLAKFQGIQSYILSSSSIDTTFSWLTNQGFKMDSVNSYRTSTNPVKGWSRDDGGSQEKSLQFADENSTYLPKFLENVNSDYSQIQKMWKTYYAYSRSFANHPNGVVGISSIQIAVDSIDIAREKFKKMGLVEIKNSSSKNTAKFKLKRNQELHLITPYKVNDQVSEFLGKRESGVFSIRFEVENLDSTFQFLSKKLSSKSISIDTIKEIVSVFNSKTYGVRLEFIKEPTSQALMAQQLKIGDTLDIAASKNAAAMYQKYCALCHAEDRSGYAADNAPSLRSRSLLASSKSNNFMRYTNSVW